MWIALNILQYETFHITWPPQTPSSILLPLALGLSPSLVGAHNHSLRNVRIPTSRRRRKECCCYAHERILNMYASGTRVVLRVFAQSEMLWRRCEHSQCVRDSLARATNLRRVLWTPTMQTPNCCWAWAQKVMTAGGEWVRVGWFFYWNITATTHTSPFTTLLPVAMETRSTGGCFIRAHSL